MTSDIPRILDLSEITARKSSFLFGPRGAGKTRLIELQLAEAMVIDLLSGDFYLPLSQNPSELAALVAARPEALVVIDEVQKLPMLLDEVHRLIEKKGRRFLLTGSSARKLKRNNANMLGGRATQAMLLPFTWQETSTAQKFDLERFLLFGSLPRVYLSDSPREELLDYITLYLKEEIQLEAEVRNLPAFSRFLKLSAQCSGELLNYANIASDIGLSAKTIKDYFEILDDTLIGYRLEPWREGKSRKSVATAKHYLFDCGVIHALTGTKHLDRNSNTYGLSFEHFVISEVRAYNAYRRRYWDLNFWRTKHGEEVDLVIDNRIAIEIKSTQRTSSRDSKGLSKIAEENDWQHRILVSQDPIERKYEDGLSLIPWELFFRRLWDGEFD
ncbi:MAG: ATP-binding protein [Deltaproteobacteria bacterium]|nr:ATP-binding protein [Deltaproteobacteria bacterium]